MELRIRNVELLDKLIVGTYIDRRDSFDTLYTSIFFSKIVESFFG